MLLCAVAAIAVNSNAVMAQEVASKAPADSLGDIVVTAQKRSESAQRAAVSITALSGDSLVAAAKNTVSAALADVPAVAIQGNANGAQIYVRGVGSNADSQLGDPAVNLNVDGVYQQETEVPTSLMFDVNRVEVLRGPQGTLYGRNATAGAINIITQDPVLGQSNGYATLQGGNYGAIHSEAAINTPLGDELAARASFASERHDGYLSNGNNDADMIAGRLKLLYQPTSQLRMVIAGDYLHSTGNDIGSVEAPLSGHPAWQSDKATGYLDLTAWNLRGTADYDAGWANLSVLAAHNGFVKGEDSELLSGPSFAPPSGVADHRIGRQDSVELRASSPAASAVKWVAGLYYLHDLEVRQVVASYISIGAQPASDPELRNATTRSLAGFANVTVPLSASLRATGGIRYTHDEKAAGFVYTDGSGTPDAHASQSWNSVTYKGELEADLGPHSLAYAQVSSGFKAGGFAQQFPAASYNPEKLTAVELGSKNRFLDSRLQVNLSVFHYSYSNYQAQYPDLVGGAFALVTSNAATAKLYGGEIETRFSLSPDDTLGISANYEHSKFGTFTYTSMLAGPVDHTGDALPNAPTVTADLSYDHIFHLTGGATITAHANSHISHGYWTTVEHSADSYQPSFTRTDAYVRFEPASQRWELRAFVRNLENTPVRLLGAANPFDSVLLIAPPRTFGGAATLRF
jgi:iron complex outermembrane receptor protein